MLRDLEKFLQTGFESVSLLIEQGQVEAEVSRDVVKGISKEAVNCMIKCVLVVELREQGHLTRSGRGQEQPWTLNESLNDACE